MIRKLESLAKRLGFESAAELRDFILGVKSFYYTKIEFKPKESGGKMRLLTPPRKPLKLVQKKLNRLLQEVELPEYVHGSVRKRSNITNARQHLGNKHFFVTDLKAFFPSISHHRVYDTLISCGFSPDVARAITLLTTFRGILPQGTPTSSTVANLCFLTIDERLYKLACSLGCKYTRYVDDLSFSSPSNILPFAQTIIDIISAGGFKVSRRKTKYKTGPANITGGVVKNNVLRAPEKILAKLLNPAISETARASLLKYKLHLEAA